MKLREFFTGILMFIVLTSPLWIYKSLHNESEEPSHEQEQKTD
jgi:hypothetical protein